MSQLLLTLLQLGFLALLWALVLAVIGVLRTDLYGTRLVTRGTSATRRSRGGRQGSAPVVATPGTSDRPAAEVQPSAPARPAPAPQPEPVARATQLVVTAGPLRGTTIPLGSGAVVIGRATDSTLVLDDDFASARHARLTPGPEGWVVEDLGSTNGTRVNGRPLDHPSLAAEGTAIQIGKTVLELRR